MCRLMLAVFLLAARLLGTGLPAAEAHAAPDFAGLEGVAICHGGAPADPQPAKPPAHDHACLLCPACLVAEPAVQPLEAAAPPPRPSLRLPGRAAPVPPATGPPGGARIATPPTGPPAHPA